MSLPEAHELLTSNLALVDRAIAFACRRYRLTPDDAEEFDAIVKLKLVDDDYAILRAYEERSSFATYINIVVQRMALDFRISAWGKWHPSAEAKRLGPLAVEVETLLLRDGRTIEETLAILRPRNRELTRESLKSLAERLPRRAPRRRSVALDEASAAQSSNDVEEPLLASDRRRASERVSSLLSAILARLDSNDRLILQMRFEGGMTVAQIARMLGIDQKLLYRRIEQLKRDLRRELEEGGVASGDALDLIGRDEALLEFDFGIRDRRPSMTDDATAQTEDTR